MSLYQKERAWRCERAFVRGYGALRHHEPDSVRRGRLGDAAGRKGHPQGVSRNGKGRACDDADRQGGR